MENERREKKNEATKTKMKTSKKKYFVEAAPNHPSASLQINVELKKSIKNSSLKKNKSFTWGNFEFTTSYEIYNIA